VRPGAAGPRSMGLPGQHQVESCAQLPRCLEGEASLVAQEPLNHAPVDSTQFGNRIAGKPALAHLLLELLNNARRWLLLPHDVFPESLEPIGRMIRQKSRDPVEAGCYAAAVVLVDFCSNRLMN
jgi:hypothetical protein